MTIREGFAAGIICGVGFLVALTTLDRLACWYGWRECSHRCQYCGLPLEAKK